MVQIRSLTARPSRCTAPRRPLSPVAQLSASAPLPARTRGRSKASPQPLCSGPNKPKNSGSPQRPGAVPAVCPRTALTHFEAASSGAVAKSPSTSTSGSSAAMIAGSHLSREESQSRETRQNRGTLRMPSWRRAHARQAEAKPRPEETPVGGGEMALGRRGAGRGEGS